MKLRQTRGTVTGPESHCKAADLFGLAPSTGWGKSSFTVYMVNNTINNNTKINFLIHIFTSFSFLFLKLSLIRGIVWQKRFELGV